MELQNKVSTLNSSDLKPGRICSNPSQCNQIRQNQIKFMQPLLDAIPHPVFYKDLYGVFQACNGALETLLGMPENMIIGKKAAEILPAPVADLSQQTDMDLMTHKSKVTYETTIKLNGNDSHHLVVTKALYTDLHGHPLGIIGILMDITQNLIMEQELMQSQKMASIGQLAAGVAHEINNPTGYVSSNLKTLENYQADLKRLIQAYQKLKKACKAAIEKQTVQLLIGHLSTVEQLETDIDVAYLMDDMSDLVNESREGMQRIKKIVSDLKTFAHPGQDKVQDTDINRCIETTLSIVNNELKYKANVTKDLGPLPIISANPQQLNQVFANILVNAAQAIEGRGEIDIRTHHKDDHVMITIRDTGCGIPQEHLKKIFDPFFTTKEIGKGTGLGMNISYNIVKKHNGDIRIQSREGEGTTFTIQLPVMDENAETKLNDIA